MPRARHQRGTLRTTTGKPERQLPRGQFWATWYRYVTVDGKEVRRHREKIITRELAEAHHIARDYTGPLTKGDAQRVLDLPIAQDAGTYVTPETDATFGQIAREYIALNEPHWGPHTTIVTASIIENHLIGKLGRHPVSALDSIQLQELLNSYVIAGASKSLLNKLVLYLRAILDVAVSKRVILVNPARNPGQKLRAKSKLRERNRSLTVEECQRLMDAVEGRDRLIVRIFIQCGLRPEELFALRRDDVQGDQLRVDEAIVFGKVASVKTNASQASVYLPPDLYEELRKWMDPGPAQNPLNTEDLRAWLFQAKRGGIADAHNYLNRVLKPAAKRAKVAGVNFQVLRRTSGTLFVGQARDPRLTQAHLRHADPTGHAKTLPATDASGHESSRISCRTGPDRALHPGKNPGELSGL